MAAYLLALAIGAYALKPPANTSAVNIDAPAPTTAGQLPPVDRYNPWLNDLTRPKQQVGFNPINTGYTARTNNYVKGPYPYEKYLGIGQVDTPGALWKQQNAQDDFVRRQIEMIPTPYFLDYNFIKQGVSPPSRIRSLGNPEYTYVPPLTTSPYGP